MTIMADMTDMDDTQAAPENDEAREKKAGRKSAKRNAKIERKSGSDKRMPKGRGC